MKELYKVTDLYLNAYLLVEDFKTVETTVTSRNGKKIVEWQYEDNADLREAIDDYNDNKFIKEYISKYLFTKREISRVLRADRNGK